VFTYRIPRDGLDQSNGQGGHNRILLIEDNPSNRELTVMVLNGNGFHVDVTEDGTEGLQKVRTNLYDLVLMDVRLPGMDGVTATRELQTRAPDCKVMILSAYSKQHELDEAWAAGVHGYVTKMEDAERLRDAIHAVVNGERYLSPGLTPSQQQKKADRVGPLGILSARERDVFRLLVRGMTTRQIAAELHISGKTVDTHRERILKKLALHSAVELVRYAAEHNVLDV